MHNRYKDKAQFLAVYVREAHPTDGWAMSSNDKVGISFEQPKTLADRIGVAQKCCSSLEINMPLLVDEVDDRVGHAYSGMPDRIYVIDRDGKVVYKGGRGPFGFKPGEMEQALAMLLLDQETAATVSPQGRLQILPNDEAWKRLPGATGAAPALPAWARMSAGPLPKTTARMLELDAMHRTGNRLDPKLRAMMRWAAADENQCAAARACAEFDLRRAGMSEGEVRELSRKKGQARDATEQAAVAFARKMMRAAHSVTDEEVKFLNDHYGEKQLVAMVALLAHAAFQDRFLLALNAPADALPPVTATFKREKPVSKEATKKAKSISPPTPVVAGRVLESAKPDSAWLALDNMDLRKKLDLQKARTGRIRIPTMDEVRQVLPPEHRMAKTSKVLWSLVCYGNQPELTDAWFDTVSAFREEAQLGPVLQQSIFWVVTRALQCFY